MHLLSTTAVRLQRFLDSRLQPRYLQSISMIVIVMQLCFLVVSFMTEKNNQTIFGPLLGADFASFYTAGTIFNRLSPAEVYVGTVQDAAYHQLFPTVPTDAHLPYANAPFLTLLFALLARLPYPAAYLGWLIISLLLYVVGCWLLWQSLDALPRRRKGTVLLLALSFMPFLAEGWIGGQTSALAFGALALAIYLERRRRWVLSGAVLALCLYKPTLLFLVLPMLLLTRRVRTLAGFAGGMVLLGGISWVGVGSRGLMNYINMLLFFKNAAVTGESGLKLWKYIDINAFTRLLLADYPTLQPMLAGALIGIGLVCLAWRWWQTPKGNADDDAAIWALTITATLVFNLYVGVYEGTIVVISLLLFTHLCYRRAAAIADALTSNYKGLLLLLYLTPWVSQWVAQTVGLQLFTLVLLALGIYQWRQSSANLAGASTATEAVYTTNIEPLYS